MEEKIQIPKNEIKYYQQMQSTEHPDGQRLHELNESPIHRKDSITYDTSNQNIYDLANDLCIGGDDGSSFAFRTVLDQNYIPISNSNKMSHCN